MMKNIKYVILMFIFGTKVFAQGEVAREIGNLINSGKLEEAEERDNYFLKQNPNNVDAIMMKGNILLNKDPNMRGDVILGVNEDESIYESSIGYITGHENVIVSKDIAQKVAELWKQAVRIDNTREDIHFGICQIYSISLQIDDLISYLPTLKKVIRNDNKLQYSMCNYARNIKNRKGFAGAMKVYKAVLSLYPNDAGLLSDIAAEYYDYGDADSCIHYINLALNQPDLDEISYGNAFFFFSIFEEYQKALDAIRDQSKLAKNNEYLLYQGLVEYYNNNPIWKTTLQSYLKNAKDDSKKSIAKILTSDAYKESIDDYLMLDTVKVNDAYKIILHHKFINLKLKNFSPFFNYAELLTHSKLYIKAAKEYEQLEKSNLISKQEDSDVVAFYYGWTLWCLNKKEESLAKWNKLFNSNNFYYKSAAAYFTGRYYMDSSNPGKAKECFEMVSDQANKSKYATYCWNLLKNF